MTDIKPFKCQTCGEQGRDNNAVMMFSISIHLYPICERCAAELLMQLDSKLALWSQESNNKLYVGGKPQTWEEHGLYVSPNKKDGLVTSPCPNCHAEGEPVIVNLDERTAQCRMCDFRVTLDT